MIDEMKNILKAIEENSVDKDLAKNQIQELLACKVSQEARPVELEIPVDEVIKRYPVSESGAVEIVRTTRAIFLHSTCFWVVAKPTLANNMQGGALYQTLEWYCDYMDRREKVEEKEGLDTIAAAIVSTLTLPLDAFTDMAYTVTGPDGQVEEHSFFLDIANFIVEKRNEYYSKIVEDASKENPETAADDIAIQEMMFEDELAMKLDGEIKELAKREEDATKRRIS